jgi:hypothetical protein
MPTFDTPQPISLTVEIGVGDIRIDASDRPDTVVDVRPSDPGKRADVTAAEQTLVELAGGRLLIRAPKRWRQWTPWGGHESIEVQIDLPSGSRVQGEAGVAALHVRGPIGECHFKTGFGDIRLDEAGPVELRSGAGDITVGRVAGRAEITTGTGAVGVGTIDGPATVKNSNGDTQIGEVAGDVRVKAANGAIAIELAHASVAAKTANGQVHLGEVARGAVVAQSAIGSIEVGVRDGAAAWLDLDTRFGSVRNELDDAERPDPSEEAVEIHVRTVGDITIHRSFASLTGGEES